MQIDKNDTTIVEAAESNGYKSELRNILVEPGRLTATNGRILLTRATKMEEDEQPFKPFIIDAEAFKTHLGREGGMLQPGDNGQVKIKPFTRNNIPTNTEVTLEKEESTYPDVQRVIPPYDREGQRTINLNPELLTKLLKGFKGVNSIRISVAGPEHAVRIDGETQDFRKIMGLIMPIMER